MANANPSGGAQTECAQPSSSGVAQVGDDEKLGIGIKFDPPMANGFVYEKIAEADMKPLKGKKLYRKCQRDNSSLGMHGVQRGKDGGVTFIDKTELAKQDGVVSDVLKMMGNNILEGRSIINISLPVRVFEPRSFLERMSDYWSFAPLYLTEAAQTQVPLERLKYVITFLIAGLHRGTKQMKPFNPILGETFQARYADGSYVYCEQVSHHPPVSAFEVVGPDGLWVLHGHHEYQAVMRPNGVTGGQIGPNRIDFADGTRISFNMPRVKLKGLMFGERNFTYADTCIFVDEKSNLKAVVKLNPDALGGISSLIMSAASPSDTVRGVITSCVGDKETKICDVTGSWLEKLTFSDTGSKAYWTFREFQHFQPIHVADEEALPSDSRFRADLAALKAADEDESQKMKQVLEDAQRVDRRSRDANGGKERAAARKKSTSLPPSSKSDSDTRGSGWLGWLSPKSDDA